jgi:hypothetical protein
MIKQTIVNELIKRLKPLMQEVKFWYIEDDKAKSPSVMFWLPELDLSDRTYSVLHVNVVIREHLRDEITMELAREIQQLKQFEIEDDNIEVFGVSCNHVSTIGYTKDSASKESLIMCKVHFVQKKTI